MLADVLICVEPEFWRLVDVRIKEKDKEAKVEIEVNDYGYVKIIEDD